MAYQTKAQGDLKPVACTVENSTKLWKAFHTRMSEDPANPIGKAVWHENPASFQQRHKTADQCKTFVILVSH
jgi:hypothetical protein